MTGSGVAPVLFRPVRTSDADALWVLLAAGRADTVGMTSLPSTHEGVLALCEASSANLTRLATGGFSLEDGQESSLLFAAFEDDSGEVLGTAGMTFKQGVPNLAVQVTTSADGSGLTMRSSSDPWTRTELNAIYLGPNGRGRRLGTVLSRGRFLFLHQVRSQTPSTIAAHLRGRFDDDGLAPFWNCFGAHFVPWENSLVAEAALADGPERLVDLTGLVLPLTPTDLDSLGLVNAASLPAFRMLANEGLRSNGLYDPVDGGPTVSGELVATRSNAERIHGQLMIGVAGSVDALLSVPSVARFGIVRSSISIVGSEIHVDAAAAATLGVQEGELITALPLAAQSEDAR